MNASLSHAVDRTTAVIDQLGVMWGPEARLSVTVHGLPHEQIHRIGGSEEQGFRAPSGWDGGYVVSTARRTPLGWRLGFFGRADLACPRCRELVGLPSETAEAVQMAGIVERMDGGGL